MTHDSVNILQRQDILKSLPCFAALTDIESQELASFMQEEHYLPNQLIVTEGELIDKVYIITSGKAEVTQARIIKARLQKRRVRHIPIAVLEPYESIGLNETGFFSTTGKRTATVTALTEVNVLSLTLKNLQDILKKYPHVQAAMQEAVANMLKAQLIKQSLPFVHLSHDRLLWLASKVEEVTLPVGAFVFQKGEVGESCFLIQAGQVEIIDNDETDNLHRLALLKAPALFGEATLITRQRRNATARVVEEATLLVLHHHYLSELLESEKNVADMFMTLMVDRNRPCQNSAVTAHPRKTNDNQEIVILKNPENGNYFKLSPEGWFIWQQLDGKQTIREITIGLAEKFNIFSPDNVVGLISKLAKADFISQVDLQHEAYHQKLPWWKRSLANIRKYLEIRYAFGDADRWITRYYGSFGYVFFTPVAKILLGLLALTGFVIFLFEVNDTIETFNIMPDVWLLFVLMIPTTLFSVALHELGHAFATKYFGQEVHYMGVGWFWFGPVAFTDTSDMWLSPKSARIYVNLAGIYTDILVAGCFSLAMLVFSNPYIQAFFWLFALFTYVNAFRMLSPLQELDGYYILMDVLDKPHLRQDAVVWLVKKFPKAFREKNVFRHHKAEVCYWLACIVFLILVSILTLLLQTFILKILGIHSNPYVSLLLPFMAVIVSSLGIAADIRNQNE